MLQLLKWGSMYFSFPLFLPLIKLENSISWSVDCCSASLTEATIRLIGLFPFIKPLRLVWCSSLSAFFSYTALFFCPTIVSAKDKQDCLAMRNDTNWDEEQRVDTSENVAHSPCPPCSLTPFQWEQVDCQRQRATKNCFSWIQLYAFIASCNCFSEK